MACAKKCDRCGKLYEQYNSKNDRKNPKCGKRKQVFIDYDSIKKEFDLED